MHIGVMCNINGIYMNIIVMKLVLENLGSAEMGGGAEDSLPGAWYISGSLSSMDTSCSCMQVWLVVVV